VINHEHAFVAERDPKPAGIYAGEENIRAIVRKISVLRVVTFLKEKSKLSRVGVLC
jgi:hypothetical protein